MRVLTICGLLAVAQGLGLHREVLKRRTGLSIGDVLTIAAKNQADTVMAANKWVSEHNTQTETELQGSGMFMERTKLEVNPAFGHATVEFPGAQCETKDQFGDNKCKIPWSTKLNVKMFVNQTQALGEKARIQVSIKTNTYGMASMVKISPLQFNCPICGGRCDVPIMTMNDKQIVPTISDIANLPIIGLPASQFAKMSGAVPQDRKALEELIAGPVKDAMSKEAGQYFADGMLDNLVQISSDKFSTQMVKCPFLMEALPEKNENFIVGELHSTANNVEVSFPLPPNIVPMMQMRGEVSVKIVDDNNVNLLDWVLAWGVNKEAVEDPNAPKGLRALLR